MESPYWQHLHCCLAVFSVMLASPQQPLWLFWSTLVLVCSLQWTWWGGWLCRVDIHFLTFMSHDLSLEFDCIVGLPITSYTSPVLEHLKLCMLLDLWYIAAYPHTHMPMVKPTVWVWVGVSYFVGGQNGYPYPYP